jgi:hypothetical protein
MGNWVTCGLPCGSGVVLSVVPSEGSCLIGAVVVLLEISWVWREKMNKHGDAFWPWLDSDDDATVAAGKMVW